MSDNTLMEHIVGRCCLSVLSAIQMLFVTVQNTEPPHPFPFINSTLRNSLNFSSLLNRNKFMFIFVKSRKCGRQRDVSAVEGEQGSGQGVREYHQVSQFY